eukprot:GHVP01048568.1.p1 GENE.GHVP01048568.1~~GHVP01048568.1.p1  ORF type:complete len:165 (-),score=25.18 GHVP01048568.1:34-528(-)
MFSQKLAEINEKYFAHPDKNGLSWAIPPIVPQDFWCRQHLKEKELVFVFPNNFQPTKLEDILDKAKPSKYLFKEEKSDLDPNSDLTPGFSSCTKRIYKFSAENFQKIEIIRFDFTSTGNRSTFLFRSDSEQPNLFYRIYPYGKFLPKLDAFSEYYRPWESPAGT